MRKLDRREFLTVAAGTAAGLAGTGLQRERREIFDLVISGGHLVDPAAGMNAALDIGITGGRVVQIAEHILPSEGRRVIDATGRIVAPGLIDVHVHVFDGVAQVGIQPDLIGVARGVTTLVDGGSAGATTFPGFRDYVARQARSRVYALLNISMPGMTVPNELTDLRYVDPEAAVRTIEENRDIIVGIKVRMLAGIPGGGDVEVMRLTREAADAAAVPITVHIGGQTSPLPRILDFLRPGDVVTHALRRQGSILDERGRVYAEVREAMARGIHLDVGHGRGNLDFDVAEAVLDQGIMPTTISSDVHRGNVAGPVFDLPTTLSKFMNMGMTLEQVITAATAAPARIYDFGEPLGTLTPGAAADIAIFDLVEGAHEFMDSGGKRRSGEQGLVPYAAFRSGRDFGSITR
ncbi:MAG: amidohydrolase/deacetylase family metallohydrolase [Gemmatimonadetes bacterium]|nr:amidohydrolase/deacetylase family metallohydrolase [Gemmatimonadota bacterium]